MGYHDRENDGSYSSSLRTPKGEHPYRRLAHEDPTFVANVARFTAPVKPHQRLRRLALPEPVTLPEGTRVRCVKKPGASPVVETLDGTFVGTVAAQDAQDLNTQLDQGPLPGQSIQNHIDLELEE